MNLNKNEVGGLNSLLIPLILTVLLLFGAIGFGFWSYSERSDYKNNVDEKIDAAVAVAVEKAKSEKDNEFVEKEKEPLKTYISPEQFGSFTVKYPKTWSAYVDQQNSKYTLLLQPDVVPSNPKTAYALRVEVVDTAYSQVVSQYESGIKQGKLKAAAYSLPKVQSVVGLKLDGQLTQDKNGASVVLPLRDKTIQISAETQERVGDFNNIILPNFEFRP